MEILTSVRRLYISFKSLVNDFVYSFGSAALLLLAEVQNHTVPVRERRRVKVKISYSFAYEAYHRLRLILCSPGFLQRKVSRSVKHVHSLRSFGLQGMPIALLKGLQWTVFTVHQLSHVYRLLCLCNSSGTTEQIFMKFGSCIPYTFAYTDTQLRFERYVDRFPLGSRFSAPVQTGAGAYPVSVSFLGVKAAGGWC